MNQLFYFYYQITELGDKVTHDIKICTLRGVKRTKPYKTLLKKLENSEIYSFGWEIIG